MMLAQGRRRRRRRGGEEERDFSKQKRFRPRKFIQKFLSRSRNHRRDDDYEPAGLLESVLEEDESISSHKFEWETFGDNKAMSYDLFQGKENARGDVVIDFIHPPDCHQNQESTPKNSNLSPGMPVLSAQNSTGIAENITPRRNQQQQTKDPLKWTIREEGAVDTEDGNIETGLFRPTSSWADLDPQESNHAVSGTPNTSDMSSFDRSLQDESPSVNVSFSASFASSKDHSDVSFPPRLDYNDFLSSSQSELNNNNKEEEEARDLDDSFHSEIDSQAPMVRVQVIEHRSKSQEPFESSQVSFFPSSHVETPENKGNGLNNVEQHPDDKSGGREQAQEVEIQIEKKRNVRSPEKPKLSAASSSKRLPKKEAAEEKANVVTVDSDGETIHSKGTASARLQETRQQQEGSIPRGEQEHDDIYAPRVQLNDQEKFRAIGSNSFENHSSGNIVVKQLSLSKQEQEQPESLSQKAEMPTVDQSDMTKMTASTPIKIMGNTLKKVFKIHVYSKNSKKVISEEPVNESRNDFEDDLDSRSSVDPPPPAPSPPPPPPSLIRSTVAQESAVTGDTEVVAILKGSSLVSNEEGVDDQITCWSTDADSGLVMKDDNVVLMPEKGLERARKRSLQDGMSSSSSSYSDGEDTTFQYLEDEENDDSDEDEETLDEYTVDDTIDNTQDFESEEDTLVTTATETTSEMLERKAKELGLDKKKRETLGEGRIDSRSPRRIMGRSLESVQAEEQHGTLKHERDNQKRPFVVPPALAAVVAHHTKNARIKSPREKIFYSSFDGDDDDDDEEEEEEEDDDDDDDEEDLEFYSDYSIDMSGGSEFESTYASVSSSVLLSGARSTGTEGSSDASDADTLAPETAKKRSTNTSFEQIKTEFSEMAKEIKQKGPGVLMEWMDLS